MPITAKEKMDRATRILIFKMGLFVTVPPILAGLFVFLSGNELPPWLIASLFILVACVEGVIFFWTSRLAVLATVAGNAISEVVELADTVKGPLESIGRWLVEMRDLLPYIERVFTKIDKEEAKRFLENLSGQIDRHNKMKMTEEDVAAAATRLTGGGDIE